MNESEFLRIAELARLGMPEEPEERDAFLRARRMLRVFSSQVTRISGVGSAGDPAPPCRLRADEPRPGLPEGAVFEAAPESGDRLVRVPRVL